MAIRKVFAAGVLTLSLAASGMAAATDVTIGTADGDVLVPVNPATVVTMSLGALDIMGALGVKPAGVTNKLFTDYLNEVQDGSLPVVGTLFEPDFEKIAGIEPDLIIIGGRAAKKKDQLDEIATTVTLVPDRKHLADYTYNRTLELGALFGERAKAEALVAAIQAKVAEVKDLSAKAGTALVLMTNGPKVSAFGPGSRFGFVHDDFGLTPASAAIEQSNHGEVVSFEFILDANPDWLVVVDRNAATGKSGASAAETLNNELVAETTAWKKGQVIYLDSASVYVAAGGIQSFDRNASIVLDALQKGSLN